MSFIAVFQTILILNSKTSIKSPALNLARLQNFGFSITTLKQYTKSDYWISKSAIWRV